MLWERLLEMPFLALLGLRDFKAGLSTPDLGRCHREIFFRLRGTQGLFRFRQRLLRPGHIDFVRPLDCLS
jgi:hypothetical protein